MHAIRDKAREYELETVSVKGVRLDPKEAEPVIALFRAARAAEYRHIRRRAVRFLEHIHRASDRRWRSSSEPTDLEADLRELRHCAAQIQERDYFGGIESRRVEDLLARCNEAAALYLADVGHANTHPYGSRRDCGRLDVRK